MSDRNFDPRSWDHKLDPPAEVEIPTQGRFSFRWDVDEINSEPPAYWMVVEWCEWNGEWEFVGAKCRGLWLFNWKLEPMSAAACGKIERLFKLAVENAEADGDDLIETLKRKCAESLED